MNERLKDLIRHELINAFVQGWYDGNDGKSDAGKMRVSEDYLNRIIKELQKG